MAEHKGRGPQTWVYFALAVATLSVYARIGAHDFVGFDDDRYITEEPHVLLGLSHEGFVWAFTGIHHATWHPLTSLSHMLDVELFGLNAGAHHLVSLGFHVANALLLLATLHKLTGAFWRSALVAALFALHPLHVESVAWAASRKDVLSTFFLFSSLLLYSQYVRRNSKWAYGGVFLCLALGLMAKPMLVTAPFLLLLLDYWPLQRFRPGEALKKLPRLFLEKIPFFLLSAVVCVITILTQQTSGSVKSFAAYPLGVRLENALVAYATYCWKTIWPTGLAPFYPHAGDTLPQGQLIAALIFLGALTLLVMALWRKRPHLLVGWLWFLGTLVPVIGLVQIGGQAMADRYTYVSLTGLFLMAAWSLPNVRLVLPPWRTLITAGTAAGIVLLGATTFVQAGQWKDSVTLFRHTVSVTTNNQVMQFNLINAFFREGRRGEAALFFEEILKKNPNDISARMNLGSVLLGQRKYEEATAHFVKALDLSHTDAEIHYHLALALAGTGNRKDALQHYVSAIELNPDHLGSRINAGNLLIAQNRLDEAIVQFREAVRINPHAANALYNLGAALSNKFQVDEAASLLERVLELEPSHALAHYSLGDVYAYQGRREEAIHEFQDALRIQPDFAEAKAFLERLEAQ